MLKESNNSNYLLQPIFTVPSPTDLGLSVDTHYNYYFQKNSTKKMQVVHVIARKN